MSASQIIRLKTDARRKRSGRAERNVDGFKIVGNTIRDNNNIGIDVIGYEGTSKQNDYARNGVIENNTVSHNSSYGNPAYGDEYSAGGIYVDGAEHVDIKNNTVYNNDLGIEATSEHKGKYARDIRITDNKVYGNAYTGISIGGYDTKRGGTINSVIAHNIMYRNDTKDLDGSCCCSTAQKGTRSKNIMTASGSRIFIANDYTKTKAIPLIITSITKKREKAAFGIGRTENMIHSQRTKRNGKRFGFHLCGPDVP